MWGGPPKSPPVPKQPFPNRVNPSNKVFFFCAAVRLSDHPGTDKDYNMTAHPRGITLLVNIKLFASEKLPPRHGSEVDVRQVEALFTALGFEIRMKENLKRLQLLNEIDDVACQDHSGYDCFVLWLMSHGRSGEVFCSDGNTIPIQTFCDMLSECDTLRGKPKLFFIQACRGNEEDEGVSVATDIGISSNEQLSLNKVDSGLGSVNKLAPRVPRHADFLYAFSTVDEYVSYRHEALGSYYVRGLVEAFRGRVDNDHLLDILTVVNQKVSNMEAMEISGKNKNEIKIYKMMPEVKHTLRKNVRF